eukprot:14342241-Ditylum_brightwellii.AAC.1
MLLNDADDSVDCSYNHLTHLTQFESNDGVGGCEHFKHIVKNNLKSLRSDVIGHVTHINYFGDMLVSKHLILWLRGGGLKDDRKSYENDQKDNDDKKNGEMNNQRVSKGVSFSSTAGSQNTLSRSHNHHHNYHNNLSSNNCSGFQCDCSNKYRQYSSRDANHHHSSSGRFKGRGYYSCDVNHIHLQPGRCYGRKIYVYNERGQPYNHEMLFGMQVQIQEQLMASMQVLNTLISVTERTLDNRCRHQIFGSCGSRGQF